MDLAKADWRKSSYSASESECVEVAVGVERSAVRDSKDPDGGVLVLSGWAMDALLAVVRR